VLLALLAPLYRATPARGAESAPGDTLDLGSLVREALAANPEIAGARELWRASEARVPAAGALDDPMLELELMDQPFRGAGAGERVVSLTQAIPFPGKRGLQSETARWESEAARARAIDAARRIVTEVKVAYFELFEAESRLDAMRDSRSALADAIATTRARYEAGLAGQPDLLLAKVEAAELDGEIGHLGALASAARARINLLVGREAAAPLGRARVDSLSPFDASRGALDALRARARAERPSVLAMKREVAAADAASRQARVAYRPDFLISAGYEEMSDAIDEWRAAVGVTLPIWKARKQNAGAREAERRLAAARNALTAEQNRAASAVEEQFAHVSSEREIVRLYEAEILPLADLAVQSARAGYASGQATFLVLLESLRKQIALTQSYAEYFADAEMHLAQLEEAVGADLAGIQFDLDPDAGPDSTKETDR